MDDSTPWQMLNQSRLDIPGLMQAAGQAKTRRLQEMMLSREMAQQDKKDERENKLLGLMSRVKKPGQNSPPTEGGGPVSGVGGGAGSASPSPSYAKPRSYREDNQGLLDEAAGDPEAYAALSKHLDTMDAPQLAKFKERSELIGHLLAGVKNSAEFDGAIDIAVAQGHPDLAEYKGRFSPALQQYGMAQAGMTEKYISANKQPETIRLLEAAGITPDMPEYRAAILGHVNPSQFMEVGSDATGRQVIQTRGMTGAPSAPTGAVSPSQFDEIASSVVPGITKTSGRRSAAHNANVGGVPNSYHLTGEASDYVPPKGMSMGQLAETLRQSLPGAQVINEGDHVHVEPASRRSGAAAPSGGPKVVFSTPPAPQKQDNAPSGYRWAANGTLAPIAGGPADPKMKAAALKPVPASTVNAYIENNKSIRTIDNTWRALNANPNAVGMRGYTPDGILKRTDPAGVTARAGVADIGSLKINDRSGASVTISESPRLMPFIPQVNDDVATVKKKLTRLRAELTGIQDDLDSVYAPDQGYKPLPKYKQSIAPKPKPAASGGWGKAAVVK